MKKLYITLSFVIASGMLSAQDEKTKNADKLFDRFEYVDAADAYLKLVEKGNEDTYIKKQLAESYYNVFNTKEAVTWYGKLVEKEQDAEVYYKYAQMLKAEGNYEEASKQMQKFASKAPADKRAIAFQNNPNYLTRLKAQRPLFEIKSSDISSGNSDFGSILTNDNTIYFTSARNEARKTSDSWTEEPYLDMYQATYNDNGTVSEATLVDGINTKWHDGPATVSSDGNTMYYVSESFNEKKFEKDKAKKAKFGRMYIYKATREEGQWKNSKPISLNSINYSLRNPSLSEDGKTLYFSSDMPGGIGGEDIWKVAVKGEDEYGTPENLGPKVNTEGNESFPYITDNNILYFTSDAKLGFGGYDIFEIDLNKGTEATNLGEPINTEKDDFAFSYNVSKKVAMFSSNREGIDNLYLAGPLCGVNAIVFVKSATSRKVVEGAVISALDDQNNIVSSSVSTSSGQKTFEIECDKSYTFKVSKEGFEDGVFIMEPSNGGSVLVEAYLEPIKPIITEVEVILQPIYFEFDKSNITAQGAEELDKLVVVLNENPEMVIFAKSHTDSRGDDKYNLNLSERRAKSTVQYIISKGISKDRITGQGFGESELKVQCDNCTDEQHAQNRRSEFIIVKK